MERLVTSFRISSSLYDKWRALARSKQWSMRDRLIGWISADLETAGVDLPPQEARSGWWQSFPEINGKALTAAREAAGFTQSALAKAVDLYASTISRYESGATRYVPDRHLEAIAAELGVDRGSLIKRKA